MFNGVLMAVKTAKAEFEGNVRDAFGRSIAGNVFEPLVAEAGALLRMEELAERQLHQADLLLEEARFIAGEPYGD
ncbi:hypothetical protein [Paenibacillus sabinae]|uniref:Uncharacterized protein n=1 Tax=Paenibacillus sabinae T27 TaxID=1268072 RepID=X4ZV17_9BACL|nr:hypothetical protein [Paenibacillus sabinae]AHV95629.1 hypothetical protein PSAB_03465 [Paenibacillus sabinae T27]